MLLLCTCVLGILSYEQICSAARDYSLCVRLHSSGMRPAAYCCENRDDNEQISDTINLVDGYRLRTDVRATCIRGIHATAVCVIANTEYTRSISTASTAAIILLHKGSGRAGARGPRPSSVKDDFRRRGHSEKKKPYQVRRCGVLR